MIITVLFVLVLWFVYIVVVNYRLLKLSDESGTTNVEDAAVIDEINSGDSVRKDCNLKEYSCLNNGDCVDICQDSGRFLCNESSRKCEPIIFEQSPQTVGQVCDYKHGSYFAIAVNAFVGELFYCVKRLGNLFDEKEKLYAHVCNGMEENFTVNTDVKPQPEPSDCKCTERQSELVVRFDDSSTPRCMNRNLVKYLPSFRPVV